MKIEQSTTINWGQYIHSINHHKPNRIILTRNQPSAFKQHSKLSREPSRGLKDLSTTIDHSIMLYNQIKTTQSSSEPSQRKQTQDLTATSTCAFPFISKLPLNYKQNSYKKPSINTSRSKSRVNNTISYNDDSRVETLSLFKRQITEERMHKIINQISSDHLQAEYLSQKNDKELLGIQLTSLIKNKQYFNSFITISKHYSSYLSNEINKESLIKSDLKEKVNGMRADLQRMQLKKGKLAQKMDELFKIKLFLQSVKNRTTDVTKFSQESLSEHKKDMDRQKMILNDYKEVKATVVKVQQLKSKKFLSMKTIKRQNTQHVEYWVKDNEPVFESEDEFVSIFEDLMKYFMQTIQKKDEINDQFELFKAKYEEAKQQIEADRAETVMLDRKIIHQEALLNQIKGKNAEMSKLKQFIMNKQTKSYKKVLSKISRVYAGMKASFPIEPSHSIIAKSPCLTQLEAIENSINYLLNRKQVFLTNHREEYYSFKKILTEQNKKHQTALMIKFNEDKAERRKRKVEARRHKILLLPKKKIGEKYKTLPSKSRTMAIDSNDSEHSRFEDSL